MKNFITKIIHNDHFVPVLIFFILALFTIFWIPPGMIAYFHDENIPLNPPGSLFEYFYVWRDSINLGFATSGGIQKLLPFSVFFLLDKVGFGIREIELFLYFIMLFGASFSSYLFFKALAPFEKIKLDRLSATIAGLFYALSPFIIFYVWRPNYIITRGWFYAFAPLLLYAIIKFCINRYAKKSISKPLLLIIISGLLITPSFSHPSFPIILSLLIIFIFIILSVAKKIKVSSLITSYTIVGIVLALINMFWIIPRLFTAGSELEGAASVGLRSSFEINSAPLSIDKNFMLSLTAPLFERTEWYSWQDYYLSPLFMILSVILAGIMFYPLIKPNKVIIITTISFLLFWPLMLGLSGPYGGFSSYVFDNFAIMQSFRDPGKWGFLLIYFLCFLLGIGFTYLIIKFKKARLFVYAFLVVALVGLGWPILAGKALPDKNDFPSSKISIPSDYDKLASKIKDDGQPIIQIPFHGVHNYATWGEESGYKGIDILRMKTSQPLLSYYQTPEFNELLKTLEFNFKNKKITQEQLSLLMNNINSTKIVVNKDSDNTFVKSSVSAVQYMEVLDQFSSLKKTFESNNLVMYEINRPPVNNKVTLTDKVKVNSNLISKSSRILGTSTWHIAEQLTGDINTNSDASIVLKKNNVSISDNYLYIRNDQDFDISTDEYQYIKVVTNADPKDISIAVSADGVGDQSEWLESLSSPKLVTKQGVEYVSYYSTAAISENIKYLRINVISKNPLNSIDVKISDIEAIDGLFNDYGKLTTNDINQTTYIDQNLTVSNDAENKVQFNQINPTEYEASFKLNGSAMLNFKQTFDKNWELSFENNTHNIKSDLHLVSNGFYNSWRVSGDTEGEEVTAKIKYKPQDYFAASLLISTVAIVVLVAIALLLSKDGKSKRLTNNSKRINKDV